MSMRRGSVATAAFKITLVYLIFGLTWILVSSSFVDIQVDPDWQGAFEIGKGFFYVFVTAILLYVLISRTFSNVAKLSEHVAEQDTFLDLALSVGQSAPYEWDLSTDFVAWSASAHFIPGDASLLAKCQLPGTFGTDPDQDLASIADEVEALVKAGHPFVAVLMSVENGRTRWFENRGAPTTSLGIPKVVGVITDISERVESQRNLASLTKSLDVEVKLRTENLFSANKELQVFNQAVAHDLRGPLRAIHGYAIQLQEDHENPNEEQSHLVDKIVIGSARLAEMFDGLQRIGRVNTSDLSQSEFDFSELANQIVSSILQQRPALRDVVVQVQPGIRVRADKSLVQLVLQNLIENAFKFSQNSDIRQVEIGVDSERGPAYYVRDYGPGVLPEDKERVFEPFRRGRLATVVQGQGIGLATVASAVRRMSGRSWVEDSPGGGATFWFTLGE